MTESLKRILIEIAREREDRHPIASAQAYFHPSAMGKCERRVILEHAGVQGKGLTDDDVMFFWLGDIIHDAVQLGIAKKMGEQTWNEVHFSDETYKVSGRLDTLRLVLDDGEFGVYEYKTMRTDAFRYKLPKPEHILQVIMYMIFPLDCPVCSVYDKNEDYSARIPREWSTTCVFCQGTGLVGPAKWGKIAYVGKEDGRMEVYEIAIDDEMVAAVKQKLMRLQMLAEDYDARGALPDKLPKEPITDKKGVPQVYVKSSTKFGFKKGDPKMKDDYRVQNCPYLGSGRCCGDKNAK